MENQTAFSFHIVQREPLPAERLLHVHVGARTSGPWATVLADQWQVAGLYEVWVPTDLSDSEAASCALDGLYNAIAAELAQFEFTVRDGLSGEVLQRDQNLRPYSLAEVCSDVKLVGHLG